MEVVEAARDGQDLVVRGSSSTTAGGILRRSLAAAVSAVALIAVPAVAHADTGPTVDWAHSVNDDLGTLRVGAHADAGIASLRAYIVSYATGQDVAVVDNLTLYSGTANDGEWRTPQPLKLPEYRGYRVDVEATDAAGGHADRKQVGDLAYLVNTELTLTAPTTKVTYARRSVRVSGVLTGRWPDTREVKPLVGEKISLDNVWGGWQADVPAAPDGSYGVTVPIDSNAFADGIANVEATFLAHDQYMRGGTVSLQITADPARTKLTAQANPRRVDRGTAVVLAGQLLWRSPDQGWQPVPNARLGVFFCVHGDYCPTAVGTPTTNADGRFELPDIPRTTGHYEIGYGSGDVFVANAVGAADVVVYQQVEFSDFTVTRDAVGAVTASGHLRFDLVDPVTVPVDIQFRARGTTEWKTVATVPNAQWDGTGHFFSANVTGQPVGAWRAFYAGVANQFRPIHSVVVTR
jgi:hypothetical protein